MAEHVAHMGELRNGYKFTHTVRFSVLSNFMSCALLATSNGSLFENYCTAV
jgi:hypothetical protein